MTGVGAFGDGVTGGDVDGEPFDTRVDLDGRIRTWSLFATDTVSVGDTWNVTLSGRFNRTTVRNRDAIEPGGGPGSLDGDHVFQRLNPAVGVTFNPSGAVNVYAGYSEGSRAATSIELGCADPEEPCKLPNAMAGDPPLEQVVTRTLEGGVARPRPRHQLERRRVPGRQPRRHPVCDLGPDRLRLFQELRRDPASGLRPDRERPRRARHGRRRLHLPERDLPERRDRQRREQQHQRRRRVSGSRA